MTQKLFKLWYQKTSSCQSQQKSLILPFPSFPMVIYGDIRLPSTWKIPHKTRKSFPICFIEGKIFYGSIIQRICCFWMEKGAREHISTLNNRQQENEFSEQYWSTLRDSTLSAFEHSLGAGKRYDAIGRRKGSQNQRV